MRSLRTLAAACLAALLVVAACGNDDQEAVSGPGGDATTATPADGPAEDGFPVTVENCDVEFTYDEAPTAAVTMNQHVTEILLALGLEGSMVGTAYMDSDIHPDLAAAYETVPVLAEEYPSREQVLAAEPDIVVGGFRSAFNDDAAGPRDALADAGIASYLTTGYCPDREGPQTLEDVRTDITNLGAIFGVTGAADDLWGEIEAAIDDVAARIGDATPVDVFVYDSGTDQAFTAAGDENTTNLIRLAGGRNVFDDVAGSFTEVSWEEVVDRDADVVLILDYGSTTVEEKIDFLRSHPVASTLRAVQKERFVVVELTDVVPGIRNGEVVAAMAEGFHPDR